MDGACGVAMMCARRACVKRMVLSCPKRILASSTTAPGVGANKTGFFTAKGLSVMSHPFGVALRKARVDAGLSLRCVAKVLGVSQVYLGKVERGTKPPLKRKHWPLLVVQIPTLEVDYLEHLALISTPIEVDVSQCDPVMRDVIRILARRISIGDFDEDLAQEIIDILVAE